MPTEKTYKIRTKKSNLFLRVCKGHFATSHSHLNYYVDITKQKSSLNEAKAVASELASRYVSNTVIDTILCLDGMEVIGTCIAEELVNGSYQGVNALQDINVVTPEYTGSQLIFRDGVSPMIEGKNVLILAASVSTGYTARATSEAINYYGGKVAGICSIFAATDTFMGYPVHSVFDLNDLDGYVSYPSHECPMCKDGKRIEALVNSFGFSKLQF